MRVPATMLWLGLALALAAVACGDEATSPTTGTLRVTVTTTGGDPDLDGYIVSVDNSERSVSPNDTVVFAGLGTGSHALRLRDMARNCAVTGHNAPGTDTSQVEIGQPSVTAGDTTKLGIVISCVATGMQITTVTTGADRDADGYTVTLDGALQAVVGVNGSIAITRLSADSHRVALGEVAANCTIAAPHPRWVTVAMGQVVPVPFAVSCTATTGAVSVAAATTGVDFDPTGYGVKIDGGPVRALATNGSITFEGIGEGDHAVTLSDVADNCTTSDVNPATVHVSIGGLTRDTARTTFHVACISSLGTIKVTTVTTVTPGANVDPDGYTVFAESRCDYYSCVYQSQIPVLVNGVATFARAPMGDYVVTLGGVARNCTVDGGYTREVRVPPSDTARLTFAVTCQLTGSLQLSVTTAGADPDPDGYTVRARSPALDTSAVLTPNATLTMPNLPPGEYSVQLGGVAGNCSLTGANPRAVTVPSGGSAAVAFDVACVAATPIAFVSGATGNDEIYTIKSNGTGVTRLTTNATRDAEPAWSPDGSRIAFRAERDGNAEIYAMNADGSSPVRLTSNPFSDFAPAWSPDGGKIAFVSQRDGNAEVYVMNADGTNPVRLTNDPGYDADPAWSSDGSKLAFTHGTCDASGCRGRIETMNADGSGVVSLTTGPEDLQPAWSPDGTKIVFARLLACYYGSCDHDLIVMGADGSTVATLVSGSDDQTDPAWSPDGRRIAFTAVTCDYYYYYCSAPRVDLFRVDGTDLRTLTASGSNPAWRP
jgi:Tol biopolymer transport system component